ncbi:MAG: hypothetical protein MJE63_01300, partial [Proteobacteria bacterium]|nr:hypothetical protein [Pseudomonadota bacterium]
WIHLAKHLDLLIFDEKKRLCFNLPENEIINQHKQFLLKGRQARNRELEHLGNDPLEAIDGYEEVIKIGYNLFKQVEQVKVDRVKKWTSIFKVRELEQICFVAFSIKIGDIL